MHNVLFVMAGAHALAAPAAPSLYVVGCGVLGRATCRLWREAHPGARIIGETASTASHAELERLGATPATRAARGTPAKCANVLFCAPPSAYGDEEYAAEVTEAARTCWDGSGAFLMASSGGVFAEDAGGVVDEAGATLDTPRARKLLGAERAALAAGTEDKAFYEAKLATARYYMDRYLPDAGALRRKLEAGSDSTMALGEEAFATAA